MGAAASVVTAALASPTVASGQSIFSSSPPSSDALPASVTNNRVIQAFKLRVSEASQDALIPLALNVNNGDTALYPDKGGTYTKVFPTTVSVG